MPEIGDSLGRYMLLKRLAQGGMGEVFLAAKPGPVGFGPRVALKVLQQQLASDQTFIDMLVDEANISMFLNHQNVVSVLDLAEESGTYYIAMEFVQGLNLEGLLDRLTARSYKLDVPTSLYVGTELCRALKYAHTRVNHAGEPLNIVHRDVTPANILISTQGEVKLTDFGIARAKGRIHQTQAGVLKGKFGYMAPEMIRYEQIDARVDVFCAGCVLYLMVAGRHPVAGATVMEAIQRYEDKQIPNPSTICADVPPQLDEVIMRCLEPQVGARWPSAAALANALQEVVLGHVTWRREVQDGAQRLAEMMRSLAPEVFTEPVPPELASELLSKALGTPYAPAFAPAFAPAVPGPAYDPLADTQTPEPPAPSPSPRSPSGVARPSPSGVVRPSPSGVVRPSPSGVLRPSPSGVLRPSPSGVLRPSPSGDLRPSPVVAGLPPAPAVAGRPTEDGWAAGLERDTSPPTPREPDIPDMETEESFALKQVLEARADAEREAPTAPPRMASLKKSYSGERREVRPDTGDLAPSAGAPATLLSTAGLDLPDAPGATNASEAATGRQDILEEPALPVSSFVASPPRVGGAAATVERSRSDDGRTMVGMSITDTPNDVDGGQTLLSTEALAEPELPSTSMPAGAYDDSKTMLGMSMADIEAAHLAEVAGVDADDGLASTRAYASIDVPPTVAEKRLDELETVIPLGPSAAKEWAGQAGADPTLLDGVDARQVSAALAAQRKAASQDLARAPAVIDYDKVVADSVLTGPQRVANKEPAPSRDLPRAVSLHQAAKGVLTPDMPKAASAIPSGSPEGASPAPGAPGPADGRRKVAPILRERNRAPQESAELAGGGRDLAAGAGAAPVGAKTGKWMAGQLEPNELEWGDDAAARRAVATRNAGRAPHVMTPVPYGPAPNGPASNGVRPGGAGAPGGNPASSDVRLGHPGILPPASVSSGVRYPPGTFIGPDGRPVSPPSAMARNWTVIVMLVAAFLAVGTVAGVVLFTQALWPKLRLESDPPGARVLLDGVELPGPTPFVVQVEPERPHTIELRLEGFRSERREITDGVARMKTYALEVALRRVVPSIDLGSINGRVLVNGKLIGAGSRVQLIDLPVAEPVRIRVEADGYAPWEASFERGSMVPESLDVPLAR